MHFEKMIGEHLKGETTKNGGQPLAEVIDIELALYNYDWHYNLIEIKDVLEKVELMNYSKYLLEKVNPNEKIKQGLQKGGDFTGDRGKMVADKAVAGVEYIN